MYNLFSDHLPGRNPVDDLFAINALSGDLLEFFVLAQGTRLARVPHKVVVAAITRPV
jgi:hypothetical protein